MSNGFAGRPDTVEAMDVDAWIIPSGAAGPYLGASPFPAAAVPSVAQHGWCDRRTSRFSGDDGNDGGKPKNVNVFGAPTGGPGCRPSRTAARRGRTRSR